MTLTLLQFLSIGGHRDLAGCKSCTCIWYQPFVVLCKRFGSMYVLFLSCLSLTILDTDMYCPSPKRLHCKEGIWILTCYQLRITLYICQQKVTGEQDTSNHSCSYISIFMLCPSSITLICTQADYHLAKSHINKGTCCLAHQSKTLDNRDSNNESINCFRV